MNHSKEGNQVLNISLPIVAEITIINLMSIIDLIIVGNIGGNISVASLGLSNGIMNTLVSIFISTGMCISITSIVSRKVGAKKYEEANEYASLGIFIGAAVSLFIFLFIFFFCREILIIAGAKGDILYYAEIYTKISSFSILIIMINSLINSVFRAHGDTTTPFFVSALIFFVKLIINWIFIYKLRFYSASICTAVSSVISQFIGFILILFLITYNSVIKIRIKYIIRFNKYKAAKLLKLAAPSSLEEAAYSISRLVCSFIIIRSGSIAYAANEIANSVESISVMPAIGFGLASTTIAGTNIGEQNNKKADKNTSECAIIAVAIMICFSLLFILFPDALVKIYVKDSEKQLIKYALICLAVGSLEQPTIAISSVYAGALKGIGDTKTPFFISIVSSWLIRLPLIYYFISIRHFSVVYVWWTTDIQWAFDAILAMIVFKVKIKKLRNF